MTYSSKVHWNRLIIALITLAIYALVIFISGQVFKGMLIMTISRLTLAEIDAIILGVQVMAFISVTIGMIVMVFLKTNKDSILMGYGPKEIEREINLLQSALDDMNNNKPLLNNKEKRQSIIEKQ